jgi:hypothetical protein
MKWLNGLLTVFSTLSSSALAANPVDYLRDIG